MNTLNEHVDARMIAESYFSIIKAQPQIAFQASINLILKLYDVYDKDSVIKFLCREPESVSILLDAHYRAHRYFNYGLPISLHLQKTNYTNELIVTINIPENIELIDALDELESFINLLPPSHTTDILFTVASYPE